jgi:hypothetical protein
VPTLKLVKDDYKGAVNVSKRLSVEEIEKKLGIDQTKPIQLTPSDEVDMKSKDDDLKDWYEDELREFYERENR